MGLNKVLAPLVVSTVLVSGCSSIKPEYDPLEVIAWEKCLDAYIGATDLSRYERQFINVVIEGAQEECDEFKPEKLE